MAWHGVAWQGMAWHGQAWAGMGRHGQAWAGMGRHGACMARRCMAWHGPAWSWQGARQERRAPASRLAWSDSAGWMERSGAPLASSTRTASLHGRHGLKGGIRSMPRMLNRNLNRKEGVCARHFGLNTSGRLLLIPGPHCRCCRAAAAAMQRPQPQTAHLYPHSLLPSSPSLLPSTRSSGRGAAGPGSGMFTVPLGCCTAPLPHSSRLEPCGGRSAAGRARYCLEGVSGAASGRAMLGRERVAPPPPNRPRLGILEQLRGGQAGVDVAPGGLLRLKQSVVNQKCLHREAMTGQALVARHWCGEIELHSMLIVHAALPCAAALASSCRPRGRSCTTAPSRSRTAATHSGAPHPAASTAP